MRGLSVKHFEYLAYVCRHKWYVFLACIQYGCIWRGIVHDLSKFLPSEWFPYVENFYGQWRGWGKIAPPDIQHAYNLAWLHHQRRNLHHHQYWVLNKDDGTQEVLEMPEAYVREMVADWTGAGRAIHGENECVEWYLKNRNKMILHPGTRARVENLLGLVHQCLD